MKFLHVDSIIYATVALFGFFFITLPSPADALETLSLADCISSAKVNNKALKTAAWDIQKGSETIRQKDSSNYPRIDAQVGYTMQLEPQAVIISGRVAETQEPDYLFGGVAATYTLYDFGRRAATLEQAKLANAVTSNSFQALTVNVTLQVIELYFGILELEKLIDTTVQESNQLEQHHNIAQALYDEGVVTRNDILQADVRLAGVKQKLLSLRNSRGNRWLQLNHLTGKPSSYRAELDSKTAISVYESQAINEETAFIRRGEIMALRRSSELADSAVTESRSNFFPELCSRFAVDYV